MKHLQLRSKSILRLLLPWLGSTVLIAGFATIALSKWQINLTCLASHNPAWSAAMPDDWKEGLILPSKMLGVYTAVTADGKGVVTSDTIAGISGQTQSGRTTTGEGSVEFSTNPSITLSDTIEDAFTNITVGATVVVDPQSNLVFAVLKASDGTIINQNIGAIRDDGVFIRSSVGATCMELTGFENFSADIGNASTQQGGSYTDIEWWPIAYTWTASVGDATYTITSVVYQVIYVVHQIGQFQDY